MTKGNDEPTNNLGDTASAAAPNSLVAGLIESSSDANAAIAERVREPEPEPAVETISETPPKETLPPQPAAKPDVSKNVAFEFIPAQEVNAGQLLGREPMPSEAGGETQETEEQKRGRGRPKGSRNRTNTESIIADATTDYAFLSESIFDMSTSTLSGVFGPEWNPRTPEEKKMVVVTLSNYLKHKEVKDIPPGMMLTFVLCAYSAPRLKEPSTSGKIKLGWLWLRNKLGRKKQAQPANVVNFK